MNFRYRYRHLLVLALLSIVSVSIYLLSSKFIYRIGFPLDDAWIHQTYARNLVTFGEWSFIPGSISAGSTAPLWSGLIAIGYFMNVSAYLWTYLLGWIMLLTIGILGRQTCLVNKIEFTWSMGVAIALIFEWHLVWSALSGMETIFFAVIITLVMLLIVSRSNKWTVIGGMIGLSIWIRPDGITLIVPAVIAIFLTVTDRSQVKITTVKLLFAWTCFLIPYLFFNKVVGGEWLPNTYFAKQTEYAIELNAPLIDRLIEQASLPLVGVGICLLPGFMIYCRKAMRNKNWTNMVPPLWAVGFLCLYALRLPVSYQHGRYVIPMMPVYFICGWVGLIEWVRMISPITWRRMVSRAWVMTTWIVLSLFYILGARAYGRDVAFIESEMVDTARWIAVNTERDALIAAHDIGAIGYFSERRIIDLAGLVSPEIIPIIRDETEISRFISDMGVDYLVTFPSWYPQLVNNAIPIYSSEGEFSPEQGGENMMIYIWKAHP